MGENIICVRHRDGWCATRRMTSLRYSDAVPTLCGSVVSLPWGIERRQPDCGECLKRLHDKEGESGD